MSRIALSNTGDWKLEFAEDQDVRGWPVVDKDGNETGLRVEDMIVDTDQKMVDALLLSDGTEYPARDVSIGEGVVYATATDVDGARRTADIDGYGTTVPHSGHVYDDDVVVQYDPDYRAHYETAYADHDRAYDDDLADSYRYGTEAAYHDDFRNRAYLDAEPDLQTAYLARYPGRDFDADRHAVRYGYNRARGSV